MIAFQLSGELKKDGIGNDLGNCLYKFGER